MVSQKRLWTVGVCLAALIGIFSTAMISEPSYGRQLSSIEASTIQGGGQCKDWVNVDCKRPGATGCYGFNCWRWLETSGDYDNASPITWCCTKGHACDAVVFIQDPCIYATP